MLYKQLIYIFYFLILYLFDCNGSLINLNWFPWPFGGNENINTNIPAISSVHVPYEQNSEDAKFLAEAKKYTEIELSELDECQHRVILELKSTCTKITEEDLGKLSVNLLNCQSLIEGRQTFPCTSQMSLRECTSSMDPDTWNSYHLMSNRAHAVCFISRQHQFRAMSELTVNRLMQQSHEQTKFMDELAQNQANLGDKIISSFNSVNVGQKTLESHQMRLLNIQNNLQSFFYNNFKSLTKEKALIVAGHKEMTSMISEITNKLEDAQKTQNLHADEAQTAQKLLIDDLKKLEQETKLILLDIEELTQRLILQHNNVALQYTDTLENLNKINLSVANLTKMIENFTFHFDQQYQWLKSWIDSTGQSVDTLIHLFGHCCFLLTTMLLLGFISAPTKIRLALIVAWFLNIICIITDHCYHSLNILELAISTVIITFFHWLWSSNINICLSSSSQALLSKINLTNKLRTIWHRKRENLSELRLINKEEIDKISNDDNNLKQTDYYDDDDYVYTPRFNLFDKTGQTFLARSSTPLSNVSSSSSNGVRCDARLNSGRKCRNRPLKGQLFCYSHQK